MVRAALTELELARGAMLGQALKEARGTETVRSLAVRAGVAEETVRKIERGAVPTPALFTVAAIAGALDLSLDQLLRRVEALSAGPPVAVA